MHFGRSLSSVSELRAFLLVSTSKSSIKLIIIDNNYCFIMPDLFVKVKKHSAFYIFIAGEELLSQSQSTAFTAKHFHP